MALIPVHRFPPRYGAAPKLGPVESSEVVIEGQSLVAMQRPSAPPGDGVLVSQEGVAIAAFFDGQRDLRGIQKAIFEQYGQLLYIERIHELANALSKAGLLEGPTSKPPPRVFPPEQLRAATHAGSVYHDKPDLLREQLDATFLDPEGPGAIPRTGTEPGKVIGIVSPHIDYHRGGSTYAHAYKALAEGVDADLFVVFGTAHASPPELFTLTKRHYDTPFGPLLTDAAAIEVLETELGDAIFREETVHNDEHSIELQAVYLKYLFPDHPITMLPVMCSSLYAAAAQGRRPDSDPAVGKFLRALAKATQGRRVCYIAAADLSHVGKLYGDAEPPTEEQRRQLAERDLDSMKRVCDSDAEGFFDDVGQDGETRRICGLTPIYMLLRATNGTAGRLLKYAQWFGESEGSAVTYAALTFER